MKVALAVASTLVIAVMMAMPVSAADGGKSHSMFVADRVGDLGKFFYLDSQGSHLAGDPISWWSGNSPISNAGLLDMTMFWVIADKNTLTLGMQLASPISADSVLPNGICAVQWSWFFTSAPTAWTWDWEVFVLWDGLGFTAYQVDRMPSPRVVTTLDSFVVSGHTLTVQVDAVILENQVAWFAETTAYEKTPVPLSGSRSTGGWGSPDCPDYVGGDWAWWPNLPLP